MSDTLNKKFKALADKNRLKILLYLKQGSKPAGEIAKQFSVSASTISYHLSILENSGLIFSYKSKGYIYYVFDFEAESYSYCELSRCFIKKKAIRNMEIILIPDSFLNY